MSVTYKLPYDTPLRYLPLVYILPYDLLMRCPTLRKLPRRMGAFNDPEWQEVLGSPQFRNEIMDAMAALVFPASASATRRSITVGISRRGTCPTPCPYGPRG